MKYNELEATNDTTSPERLEELAANNPQLKLLLAQNPATPPHLLQQFAATKDEPTLKAVTANPNTPTTVLMKLGEKYPAVLLENPIFALLQLENPNFILEMPQNTLIAFLKVPTLPEYIFTLAAKRSEPEILLVLANHPQTSKTILDKLVTSKNQEVAQAVKLHVNWAGEIPSSEAQNPQKVLIPFLRENNFTHNFYEEMILDTLAAIPKFLRPFADHSYKRWLSKNPKFADFRSDLDAYHKNQNNLNIFTTPLETLAQDQQWQVRRDVTNNPQTPVKLLETLALSQDSRMRRQVAKNFNSPVKLLEALAQDHENAVRVGVAKNPNASIAVLEFLALDRQIDVRVGVAKNPQTPVAILETLAVDQDWRVRRLVAKHQKLSEEILQVLAQDPELVVRTLVVQHPNTSIPIFQTLAQDSSEQIRQYVAMNRLTPAQILETLARDSVERVRLGVANNPQTPLTLFFNLSRDSSEQVRLSIARNSRTPEAILQLLARDSSEQVRLGVAKNFHTPITLLELLIINSTKYVQRGVAKNYNTPKHVALIALLNLPKNEKKQALMTLKQNPNYLNTDIITLALSQCCSASFSRLVVFLHPQTPPQTLSSQNRQSLSWQEKYAIAANPNTPSETLKILASDPNIYVRAAAKGRLDNHMLQ